MDEFAQWGTNIKFNSSLEEWMKDHCEGTWSAIYGVTPRFGNTGF